MSVLADFAAFISRADMAARPDGERDLQRRHVFDAIVAMIAGRRTADGEALAALPAGDLADAAGRAAATIRLTEIDDIHLRSCTTPSSVAVGTALMLARTALRTDVVASAIWAGTEAMTRFGAACDGPRILYQGVWPSLLGAPLAAAATAARLWGLDAARTADALSLALLAATGRLSRLRGPRPARWVLFGHAVSAGVRAAQAAAEGFGGDTDLLDGSWLRDAHGVGLDAATLGAGLAGPSVYTDLSLKPFCAAKQTLAAIEGFQTILDEGAPPDDVEHVRVRVPPLYQPMIGRKPDGSRLSTIAGVAVQLGVVAHRRERLHDIRRAGLTEDAAVMRFADKVEVVADPALLDVYPVAWPAEIEVAARGRVLRRRVIETTGDPRRPLGDSQLADKARNVLTPLVGADQASRWAALARHALDGEGGLRRALAMLEP